MTARGYIRGHAVTYVFHTAVEHDEDDGDWRYDDTGDATYEYRPCWACRRIPVQCDNAMCRGAHDPCLGHLVSVTSACCGHLVEPAQVVVAIHGRKLGLGRSDDQLQEWDDDEGWVSTDNHAGIEYVKSMTSLVRSAAYNAVHGLP